MSEKEFVTVFLGDNYFQFVTQKTGWTKAQYRTMDTGNVNDYPVYTAAQEPVAYVLKQNAMPNQASKKNPIISFGANGDGSAGTNFVYHIKPFYVSNDRTCVRVVNEKIKPLFVYYKLRDIKKIYGFDFHFKATLKNVSLVSLQIPKAVDGQFDLYEQQRVLDLFIKHEHIKKAIAVQSERISTALVDINMQSPFQEESLGSELFDLSIGKRVLKKNVLKSGIPVYSANVRQPFGFTNKSILKDFSTPSLLWGVDGIFDWNLIPENSPFMPTDHCGVLQIRHPHIYPSYIYHVLRATKERYGFDRIFRANLTNIKEVTVRLPTKKGQYDLGTQIEMANKYEKIEQTKKSIVETLDHIISTSIAM